MIGRLQSITYTLFLFLTPLLVTSFSKELFEFPKTNFLYIATGILGLTLGFQSQFRFTFPNNKLARLFLVTLSFMLIANLVSFIFSIDYYTSLFGYYTRFNGGLISILCMAIWFLFFANYNLKKDDVEKILLVIFVSGVMVAIFAILQKFGLDENYWKEDASKRVFSTLGQPNWLAAFLIPIFYLSLYFSSRLNIHPLLKFTPIIGIYLAIIFTYSISGILAFMISILVYGLLNMKEIRTYFKKYLPILLIILAASFLLSIPLKDRLSEQVKNMYGIVGLIESNSSQNLQPEYGDTGKIRLILWDGTIALITSSPKQFLIGSGPETFVYVFTKFRPDSINATSEANFVHNKPHNWYLEIFANLGLFGFIAYISFIIVVTYVFLKAKKTFLSKILFCGWLSILLTNFFGWPTVPLSILFFLMPIFMNYQIFEKPKSEDTRYSFSVFRLFIVFLVGNFLIFSAVMFTISDYQFKKGEYVKAHQLNPLEPRYELFLLIHKRESNADTIRHFYYKNRRNPYVVKTLMNYLEVMPDLSGLKSEIIIDAAKNSPSDKQFRN